MTRTTKRGLLFVAMLAVMAMVAAACGGTGATTTTAPAAQTTAAPGTTAVETTTTAAPATTTTTAAPVAVSLRLPWFINAQFAGSLVALEKGYFADEGLDVTINPGGFDVNSITLVASGTDTFGLHDTGSLLFARAEGIPLVSVGTFLQKHPGAVMALADSGISTLDDFKGKTIGFQEGGPWMLVQAMLTKNGIDPASMKQVTVGFDLSPLFNGDVDLFTVFATNEPLLAEEQGFNVNVFVPYDYGVETSANALFTTEDYLAAHGDVACAMERAMAKGWDYALDNKDEAVDIVLAASPEELSRDHEMKALELLDGFVRTPDSVKNGLGYMTEQRWQTTEDVLAQYGGLDSSLNVADAFSTQCLNG